MAIKRSADAIDGKVIISFIEALTIEEGANHTRKVNGHPISETTARALYRWRSEGVHPRVNKVEATLAGFGLMMREFEEWAEERCRCIWINGAPPAWWTDESESLWRQDLKSADPEWRAEARAYGIAIGEIPAPRKPSLNFGAEEIKVSRQRIPVAA